MLIAELGLRYPANSSTEQSERAGQLALLARDLAKCNPRTLAKAINKWVQSNRFMPRASELLSLCAEIDAPPVSQVWERRMLEGNRLAILKDMHKRMHWKIGPAGYGTEIVAQPMPSAIYQRAMSEVNPAIFDNLRSAA